MKHRFPLQTQPVAEPRRIDPQREVVAIGHLLLEKIDVLRRAHHGPQIPTRSDIVRALIKSAYEKARSKKG